MGHGVWPMQMNSTQYQLSSMRRIPDRSSHHVEVVLLTACVHTALSWKHGGKLWVHMPCCSSLSVLSDSVYVCLLYILVCATFKDGALPLFLFLKMGLAVDPSLVSNLNPLTFATQVITTVQCHLPVSFKKGTDPVFKCPSMVLAVLLNSCWCFPCLSMKIWVAAGS